MAKKVKYYNGDLVEYEIYKLVDFYDKGLRTPTVPFDFNKTPERVEDTAAYIAFSLAQSLEKYQGLGLSANQVGLRHRVCVINMGDNIWTLFNPEVVFASEDKAEFSEGCLSYPGLYLKLNRPKHIKVRFQAIGGQHTEHEFDGLTAVCVQHEIDHLDGKMYTDMVSPLKLQQAKKKVKATLKKMQRIAIEQKQPIMVDENNNQEKKLAGLDNNLAGMGKFVYKTE